MRAGVHACCGCCCDREGPAVLRAVERCWHLLSAAFRSLLLLLLLLWSAAASCCCLLAPACRQLLSADEAYRSVALPKRVLCRCCEQA